MAMRRAIREPGVVITAVDNSEAMADRCRKQVGVITAVDNSEAMADRCRKQVSEDNSVIPVKVVESDIRQIRITNASVVVLNFTLQFLPPAERLALLSRIFNGLKRGGILVLSEKLCFDDDENSNAKRFGIMTSSVPRVTRTWKLPVNEVHSKTCWCRTVKPNTMTG
jgi:cyclopropane fatty-acyl-phospholipid synthase-like methyltransferase